MTTICCPQSTKKAYYNIFTFPAGEPHLQLCNHILDDEDKEIDIQFNFSRSEDIIELLLLVDTLRRNNFIINELLLPYLPFGQADRVNEHGECFSLKWFCNLVNEQVRPKSVRVYDPHSDVGPALFDNCEVVHQHQIVFPIIEEIFGYEVEDYNFSLVCPDAGAAKKIHKLNALVHRPIITCEKLRCTHTGKILSTKVYSDEDLMGRDCVIIDDCVVGGRTYIEISKILKQRNVGQIILITTNGVYSQGIDVFDGLIDQIWNRQGRVK